MNARFVFILVFSLLLAGCESLSGDDIRLARAEPLFGENYDHCFDDPAFLLSVMAPEELDLENSPNPLPVRGSCNSLKDMLRPYFVKDTFDGLRYDAGTIPYAEVPRNRPSNLALQRNEVMHALVTISNRKCGVYSAHLKTFDGQTNSLLSVLAIATGGIGGVVSAAGTARAFSSASAIASGSRVALNDAWFSNQTIQVLVAGYEKERSTFLRTMNQRQVCPITHYPVMAGIADAMQYHSQCSLITGLSAAAQAIERSDEPGLEVMRRQLVAMAAVSVQAESLTSGLPVGASETTLALARQLAEAEADLNRYRTQNAMIPSGGGGADAPDDGDGGGAAANPASPGRPVTPIDLVEPQARAERIRGELNRSIKDDEADRAQKINQRFALNSSQAEKLVCPFDGDSAGAFIQ
jgi:hypothetical protein